MLDARAVALQGIGFSPVLVALQGFAIVEAEAPTRRPRTNARFEPYRPEVGVTLAQLQQEDELATELLLTLVTKGFFDGTFKS